MTSPEFIPQEKILLPTLDGANISVIESPSMHDLYSLYSEGLPQSARSSDPMINKHDRLEAAFRLNREFFRNPGASYEAELWVTGATAMFTYDKTIIEQLTGLNTEASEETLGLPPIVGCELMGSEEIQGFFGSFATGPIIDLSEETSGYLDHSFCIDLLNPIISTGGSQYAHSPEFFVGRCQFVLSEGAKIGIVTS